MTDPRRGIPAVETVLADDAFDDIIRRWGRERVARAVAAVQAGLRERLAAEPAAELPGVDWYARRVADRLEAQDRPRPAAVINATGVVLHTNLGRAPLAEAALRALAGAGGYAALEYDVAEGGRGSRQDHCAPLLCELTGAEAALVVNNNAAAVVLALNTLSLGRESIISRGELVEIGGSFRVPEIMARSGAIMREVGSTNRTHPRDYSTAFGDRTGLVLKVHRSNFRQEGFTAEVGLAELSDLARAAGVPVVNDLGSGLLVDLTGLGLPREPTAREALAAGADLVTMSGDKLLGGPQAGILVGRRDLVDALRSNPLYRALRPDKLTLAALHATLVLYRDEPTALREVPVLRMLSEDRATQAERAATLVARLGERGIDATTADGAAAVGGGAYPGVELPGVVVTLRSPVGASELAARLRAGAPPVITRVRDGRVVVDLRTVPAREEAALVDAVARAVGVEP